MELNLSPTDGTGRFWITDSRRGVIELQEWHVTVLKRTSSRVLVEDADWRRVWKSAGRRMEG